MPMDQEMISIDAWRSCERLRHLPLTAATRETALETKAFIDEYLAKERKDND